MSGATFGRKGAAQDADLAARRAAFLAEERARAQSANAERRDADDGLPRTPLSERRYGPEKTAGVAYLLWFFLGGLSAHRFYLGFHTSAIVQLIMTPIAYAMMIAKSPAGVVLLVAAGLWILVDAFFIPGMVRKANARGRGEAVASVFA